MHLNFGPSVSQQPICVWAHEGMGTNGGRETSHAGVAKGLAQRQRRTMHMEPPTAKPMPPNFFQEPVSCCSMTASMAVKTGMVGCMQVATTTPDRSNAHDVEQLIEVQAEPQERHT